MHRAVLNLRVVVSLVIEQIQVNKAPKCATVHELQCCKELILIEKEQIVPRSEKEVAQNKRICQKKLKKQNSCHSNKLSTK
jgi:hypothetical protein